MSQHAVCYVASDGYLFQTLLSALQARTRVSASADVIVVAIGRGKGLSAEQEVFAKICDENGVIFCAASWEVLEGQHPMWGRLFLDRLVPDHVQEILYLDGDTQVVGDIDPLMFAVPPAGGAIGVRDPIVFIRQSVPAFVDEIDQGWDRAGIPIDLRARYLNSGMLRLARDTLPAIRDAAIEIQRERGDRLRFVDQDAINIALDDRVDVVSMQWNFPGFLLDSQVSHGVDARIIHFMSSPRPWNAPLWPWGRQYYTPYVELVDRYHALADFWPKASAPERVRFAAQQAWKRRTERPAWNSEAVAQAVTRLESAERLLV